MGYYLTAGDGCLYYGRSDMPPQQLLCDGGEERATFRSTAGLFVVSYSETTDSSQVYFMPVEQPTQVRTVYSVDRKNNGIKGGGGR